ncbi:G-protein alpha subunit [Lactarius indigo]|nr:G-protein alpha subunit [Lactarius indigo]
MVLGFLASWKERREEWRVKKRAKTRSDEIDRQIENESIAFKRTYDVLLMGSYSFDLETSAIGRQMKIIYQDGYSREELLNFRPSIWRYLLETSRRIVQDLRDLGLEPATHANKANCERILNHPTDIDHPEFFFRPEFADAVQELWADDIVPVLLGSPTYFPLADNVAYFFPDAHRMTSREYIPSDNDILRAPMASRVKVIETYFPMGQLSIRLCHVIGQRSMRTRWTHIFESTTSIIFCASLLDYDRWDEDGEGRPSFPSPLTSLALFESVVNSRWFLRTSIILFLTGIKEFKDKLYKVPLENYFPEYTGGADTSKGAKYILWRFMQANRARLNVYPHVTDVFDTSNIRLVFIAVKETFLQNALRENGIL